jgi:hypothetical protein
MEALYQFLKWLAPVIEKFPKNHKFTLGDRIYGIALDICLRGAVQSLPLFPALSRRAAPGHAAND